MNLCGNVSETMKYSMFFFFKAFCGAKIINEPVAREMDGEFTNEIVFKQQFQHSE